MFKLIKFLLKLFGKKGVFTTREIVKGRFHAYYIETKGVEQITLSIGHYGIFYDDIRINGRRPC